MSKHVFVVALLVASYAFMPEGPWWQRVAASVLALTAGAVGQR